MLTDTCAHQKSHFLIKLGNCTFVSQGEKGGHDERCLCKVRRKAGASGYCEQAVGVGHLVKKGMMLTIYLAH